ncbi:protein DENND6B-like [Schistocerca gregaria]|uniref:protein DENND6B-like n=1 Tax=Schistocerca gregaria TaxID=7010 RepID=UPI00211DB822|nr:protein DENND6B-like [Schistocerca gregaria]XP_049852260.1 protein DENND6B-like [Schistocerca gregaria]
MPECEVKKRDTIYAFRFVDEYPGNESRYLNAMAFFRQEQDQSSPRGFQQKSVVAVFESKLFALYRWMMSIIGPVYFQSGEAALRSAYRDTLEWPPMERLLVSKEVQLLGFAHLSRVCKNISYNFDFCATFRYLLPKLWLLWELVMLAESVWIISPSPDVSSQAVLLLVSLISPLEYQGDFRPFFTIRDLNASFEEKRGPSVFGELLGVTNPYFFKAFSTWPNRIVLRGGSDAHHFCDKDKISTQHQQVFPSQTQFLAEMQKMINANAPSGVVGRHILKHFRSYTQAFLTPLEIYLQRAVLPNPKELRLFRTLPTPRDLQRSELLNFLKLNLKFPSDRVHFYNKFTHTFTFLRWYYRRVVSAREELKRRYLDLLNSVSVALLFEGKSEVEVIDLYLEAKSQLRNEGQKLGKAISERLGTLVADMLSHISEDLEQGTCHKEQAVVSNNSEIY